MVNTSQGGGTKFWFPAKSYGWGWGIPNCWQGWAVFAAYAVLMVAGALVLDQKDMFTAYTIALSLVLVGVCWWKGEPPKWRWGA